jgi:hypothetical protein
MDIALCTITTVRKYSHVCTSLAKDAFFSRTGMSFFHVAFDVTVARPLSYAAKSFHIDSAGLGHGACLYTVVIRKHKFPALLK